MKNYISYLKILSIMVIGLIIAAGFMPVGKTFIIQTLQPGSGSHASGQYDETNPTEEPNPATQPTAEATSAAENSSATSQPAPVSGAEGKLVSDLGFRPDKNGFSFENYGSDANPKDLTAVEVRRMFGDQVCAELKDGQCTLTPTGQQWMEAINKDMAGGHCEGFAALSLLMFANQVKPDTFGGNDAFVLPFTNESLQREIAYWWATQAVSPTSSGVIKGTPNDILDVLKKLKSGDETYTIGIYKRDGSGGHAITPYAVEDDGSGLYSILVYDNNYPKETRKVKVDSNKNTWSYTASINPSAASETYEGDADTKSLDLTPTSVRLNPQNCPFCSDSATSRVSSGLAATAPKYNQIYLDGEGHLLIQDEKGNQLGYVDGKLVNKIPGASFVDMKVATAVTDSPEPVYQLPEGLNVQATIDGSQLTKESKTDLEMIGPGFSVGVEGIGLDPKQKDTVNFFPKDQSIVYDTTSSETPNFVVTTEQSGGTDYEFDIQGADMKGGGTITVSMDTKKGDLLINTEKMKNEGKFSFTLNRYTSSEEETYTAENIALKAGAVVYINYADWKGNGKGLTFGVDTNGDGTIDDTYTVDDSK